MTSHAVAPVKQQRTYAWIFDNMDWASTPSFVDLQLGREVITLRPRREAFEDGAFRPCISEPLEIIKGRCSFEGIYTMDEPSSAPRDGR